MYGIVSRCAILARVLEENRQASGVIRGELGQIVDLTLYGNPEGAERVVARELQRGDCLRHCQ